MAIVLGLIAALAWGVHDICVRVASQRTAILTALLVVLVSGAVMQSVVIAVCGEFDLPPRDVWGIIAASGASFAIANIALYQAFKIGPVQLVAPLIASYAILSVLGGVAVGQAVGLLEWAAVVAVFLGVSMVAILSKGADGDSGQRRNAIGWSLLASVGFAATFHFGQLAAARAPELMVIFSARVVAIFVLLGIIAAFRRDVRVERSQWKVLVLMGALDATAISSVLLAGGMEGASFASVAASTFGLVTIVLAWAFLREAVGRWQWLWLIVTFAAIALLAR